VLGRLPLTTQRPPGACTTRMPRRLLLRPPPNPRPPVARRCMPSMISVFKNETLSPTGVWRPARIGRSALHPIPRCL